MPRYPHPTIDGHMIRSSFLGACGKGMYFADQSSDARRENPHIVWTPVSDQLTWQGRLQTRMMRVQMHLRLGDAEAVEDLLAHVAGAPLEEQMNAQIVDAMLQPMPTHAVAA